MTKPKNNPENTNEQNVKYTLMKLLDLEISN
uniref:Uncharacterized protein n=1 Tax=Anguilla anguilla TaxID=7936 RepID=A0A0E9SN29_ANGAN